MAVTDAAVGSAVELVIKPVGLLCSWVGSKIKTAVNLQSNIDAVKEKMKSLMVLREEVNREKEATKKEGNEIRAQVVTWLEDVENLESRVDPIRGKKPSACFLNCCKRYRESNEVEGILKEIERLLKDGNFESGVAYPTRIPRAVEHIPGPSIQGQTTASKNLYETLKVLHDDKVRRIGIWGMGGVGKTTLVKNLNNKLENASTQPFGIIIWVTVTRNLVIKNVQTRIAERLNLEVKIEESVEGTASRLYQRLEREENFLLILDDVWKEIELGELGVPQPEDHKGCKVILTSRRMEVCRNMMTDVEIKMEVLNDDEAWQLFSQKAAIEADHFEQIRPFAEAIAREGCGLPLAIITMGAAMRRKTKVELWKNALTELKRSVPTEDIEKKVFERLKWSYDSLEGNNIKSCFLYCSLFPEDFSIEISELVNYWKAEGLIGGQNYEDSVNKGITLIENLKDSCLLEDGGREGTVKMHDVVRDVAIWIASSFEDNCKSLVRSGMDLSEISVGEFSNSDSLKRVSFMNNKITRLPDSMIQCSEASTLLLQNNRTLVTVPETFLQGFKALRVLNLSETDIRSVPQSLLQLNDLRALFLGSCRFLEELPPLGMLSKLQNLDLSYTRITELPREMETLSQLRQLNISNIHELKTI